MNNSYIANNNLISNYHNFQRNNIPFQNNPLLYNNPHFQNMINKQQFQHMIKYKQAYEMQKMQKSKDIDTIFDKNLIHESVIRPIKVVKENTNNLINLYNDKKKEWDNNRIIAWKERTNQPYKNVLYNQNYDKFIGKDKINVKDLIVHTVTDIDKLGLETDLNNLKQTVEKHNNELKTIYSTSKELEHKKNFEYVHRDKYRIKYDPKDYEGLKKDQVEYYKKEQQQLEKNKENIMNVIDTLLNNGVLNEEDIKNIEKEEKLLNNDDDINNLENQLRKELGNDYDKLEKDALKILENKNKLDNNNNLNNNINNNLNNKSGVKKKITIKTINNNNTNNLNTSNTIHTKINNNIDDLKQKYLSRQKK